jgi:hypothetical protein
MKIILIFVNIYNSMPMILFKRYNKFRRLGQRTFLMIEDGDERRLPDEEALLGASNLIASIRLGSGLELSLLVTTSAGHILR